MIGGEGARDTIARFTGIDQSVVIDELLRAWRLSEDPEKYATTVLADVDFGDRRLEIQRWSRVQYLRHLTKLTVVSCRGDLTPLDPLAAIPRLHRWNCCRTPCCAASPRSPPHPGCGCCTWLAAPCCAT